jgi:hypothetical protein
MCQERGNYSLGGATHHQVAYVASSAQANHYQFCLVGFCSLRDLVRGIVGAIFRQAVQHGRGSAPQRTGSSSTSSSTTNRWNVRGEDGGDDHRPRYRTTFRTEDEAIRLANNTEYGLAAYVFACSPNRGIR